MLGTSSPAPRVVYPSYYVYNETMRTFAPQTLILADDARSLRPDFRSAVFEGFRYNGQHGEDGIVLDIFKDKHKGYFVDLAAHAWKSISNTYSIEHFNDWGGICIEANPAYLSGLLSNRKCKIFTNVVAATTGEKLRFDFKVHDKIGGVIGGLIGEDFDNHNNHTAVDVVAVTLQDILIYADAPKIIEYFSLDIEGAEFYAMKGFPFANYTFLVITVERPNKNLHHLFTRNGYVFVSELTGGKFGECLYLHHTIDDLMKHVEKYGHKGSAPPTWFGQPRPYLMHPRWNNSISHYQLLAHNLSHNLSAAEQHAVASSSSSSSSSLPVPIPVPAVSAHTPALRGRV